MLKFKIKEKLLALDKRQPQTWLVKVCSFTRAKAYNIINLKQKSISLADLSELCCQLKCTPNDLFYWQNTPSQTLPTNHPCITQLTLPDEEPQWRNILKNMYPHEVEELKSIAEEKIKNRNKG